MGGPDVFVETCLPSAKELWDGWNVDQGSISTASRLHLPFLPLYGFQANDFYGFFGLHYIAQNDTELLGSINPTASQATGTTGPLLPYIFK